MKKIILLFVGMIFLITVVSAQNYQAHPLDCPDEYNFVSCTGGELQCGIEGGLAPYCYDMTLLNPPGSDETSDSGDTNKGSLPAGFIVDCESTDAPEPYCNNGGGFWCNRNTTCFNVGRKSTCKANTWSNETGQTDCDTCRTGYTYCDGSYTDDDGCEIEIGVTQFNHTSGILENHTNHKADCGPECDTGYLDCDGDLGGGGDGCEILDGGACNIGVLNGTFSGCAGGFGNCIISKSNFETGTNTAYSTNDSLLWGSQYGAGYLINMTNGSEMRFGVNKSGCIVFSDGTTQCSGATDTNVSGYVPYSNATQNVNLGDKNITTTGYGFFGWLGSISNFVTGLFVQDINASGNVFVKGNLSVNDLIVRSGQSIRLAGASFENEGHYTSIDTNWIIEEPDQPTAFMGVYAKNGSPTTAANIVLEALNSTFNIIKMSPDHPFVPNASGITNEGDFGTFVGHEDHITWWHYTTLDKDKYGNIQNLTDMQRLMMLNDSGLYLEQVDLMVNGSATIIGDLNVIGTSYLGNITINADNITVNNIHSRDGNITFYNSSGSETVRITSDGKVGIGTSNPTQALDVNGSVNVSGDLTIGSGTNNLPPQTVNMNFYDNNVGFAATLAYLGWDLDSAQFDNNQILTQGKRTGYRALAFSPNGTKMYLTNYGTREDIVEFTLSTAWDVSSRTYIQTKEIHNGQLHGLYFKPDGTRFYWCNYWEQNRVEQSDLGTPWDVSTESSGGILNINETKPKGVFLKGDGLKLYVAIYNTNKIQEFDLSSAWDITTGTYAKSLTLDSGNTEPTEIFISDDGSRLFVADIDGIYEYDLAIPWDVSTGTLTTLHSEFSGLANGMAFSTSGDLLYTLQENGNLSTYSVTDIVVSKVALNTDYEIGGNLNVSDVMYVDATSGKVGIGTTTPNQELVVVGDLNVTGNLTVAKNIDITNGSLYQPVYGSDDELVLYLPFSEDSSETITEYDRSPYGNDGTLENGVVCNATLGKYGSGCEFDGDNDYVDVGSGINLVNKSFSWEFWAKRSISGTKDNIIGQGVSVQNKGLIIGFRDNNRFIFAFWNNDLDTISTYVDNNWHYWAGTYDASTNLRKIYVDGILESNDTASADYMGSGTLCIAGGCGGWGSNYFNGSLDEVMVYERALSEDEIRTHYLRGSNFNSMGAITADKFRIVNTSGDVNFIITGTNVGIGTTNPTQKLDVNGSVLVRGDLNITGVSYLGDVVVSADNITVNNIIPRDGGNVSVQGDLNVTGGIEARVVRVNGSNVCLQDGTNCNASAISNFTGAGLAGKVAVWAGSDNVSYDSNLDWNFTSDMLTVSGDLNVTGTSYLGNITINADNITVNNIHSRDGNITFYNSSGSETVKITNDGKVGIGTTDPEAKLDVDGGINAVNMTLNNQSIITATSTILQFKSTVSSSPYYPAFRTADSDGTDDLKMILSGWYQNDSSLEFLFFGWDESKQQYEIKSNAAGNGIVRNLSIYTRDDDDQLFLNTNGNVGINTSSPTQALDVNGNVLVQGDLNVTGTSYLGDITLTSDNITVNNIHSKDGNITFYNNTGSETVRITSDGKVGIGTSSPESNLHVVGSASPITQLEVERNHGGSGGAQLKLYHNTASPADNDYVGSINFAMNDSAAEDTFGKILVQADDVTNSTEDSRMSFQTYDSGSLVNGLTIVGSNVGIGTSNATQALDVNGSVLVRGDLNVTGTSYLGDVIVNADNITVNNIHSRDGNITFYNNSGSETVRITSDGKVGIGTSSPTQALDVNGSLNVNGDVVVEGELNVSGNTNIDGNLNITGNATYTSDNSAYYTDRSLVDKEYADSFDNKALKTGIISGGALSIATASTINIAPGTGIIINATNTSNIIRSDVSWDEVLGYAPNLSLDGSNIILVDSNGNISDIRTVDKTDETYRDYIILGTISIYAGGIIMADSRPFNLGYVSQSFEDFERDIIGPATISGLVYSSNSDDLALKYTSGRIFDIGCGFALDAQNTPNECDISEVAAPVLFMTYHNGSTLYPDGVPTIYLNPTKIDNGDGTTSPVGNNKWTVQRIFYSPTATLVSYGQEEYNTYDLASDAINTQDFFEAGALPISWFRAYLIINEGATDLSDTTQAVFYKAPKFRLFGTGGGVTGGVSAHSSLTKLEFDVSGHLFENGGVLDIENYNFTSNATISTTGKIGIGTTSPTQSLDVNGSVLVRGDLNVTGTSYLGDITLTSDNITVNNIHSRDGNITFYNNSGSETVRITDDGNVGIGTSSPSTKLDVNGSVLVRGDLNVTGTSYLGDVTVNADNITVNNIIPKDGGNVTVRGDLNVTGTVFAKNFSGNSDITFINASGDAIVTFQDDGDVGIGVTNPLSKLTIIRDSPTTLPTGSTQDIVVISGKETGTGSFRAMRIIAERDASANAGLTHGLNAFAYDYTDDFNITHSTLGLVGQRARAAKFGDDSTIMSARAFSGKIAIESVSTGSVIEDARIFGAESVEIENLGQITNAYSFYGQAHDKGAGTIGNAIGMWLDKQTAGTTSNRGIVLDGDGAGADIVFGEDQDANIYWDGTALVLNGSSTTINGDLNVTGTSYLGDITLTSDNITVNNIHSKDGNITFYNNTGSETVRITDDGKVGIGTNSPQQLLHLDGGKIRVDHSSDPAMIVNHTGGKSAALVAGSNAASFIYDNSGSFSIQARSSADVVSGSPNIVDSVLLIDSSGDVGIGTTSPAAKLDVNGSVLVRGDLNVTGTSYLGDVTVSADNITVNNLVPRDGGNVVVRGDLNVTGNITADWFLGSINASNVQNDFWVTNGSSAWFTSLNVTGTSYLGDVTVNADNITVNNIHSKDGNITFYNNSGSETVRITQDGNVGIGTSIPEEKLELAGDFVRTSQYSSHQSKQYMVNRTVETSAGNTTAIGAFVFSDGAGYIEIDYIAHVSGYSIAAKYLIPVQFNNQDQGLADQWLKVQPISYTGDYGSNEVELDIYIANAEASLRLRRVSGSHNAEHTLDIKTLGNTVSFTPSTTLGYDSAPSLIYGPTVLTQRSGKVGIGTSSPSATLEVNGNTTITGNLNVTGTSYLGDITLTSDNITVNNIIPKDGGNVTVRGDLNVADTVYAKNFSGNSDITFINSSGDAIVTFKDAGNVGIGTTSPSSPLHVNTTNDGNTVTFEGGDPTLHVQENTLLMKVNGLTQGSNEIIFQHNDGDTDRGNASITTSWWNGPGMAFKLPRDFSTWGFLFENNAGDDLVMIQHDGEVGIGTTSPAAKLDVNGSVLVRGDLNVTGTSYLGDVSVNADNITVNNIIPKDGGDVDIIGDLDVTGDVTASDYLIGSRSIVEVETPTPYGIESDELVGYWAGNGNRRDYSGDGYSGSLKNGATYSDGVFGTGFEFDGVDDWVSLGDHAIYDFDSYFTVSAWVKLLDLTEPYAAVVAKGGGTPNGWNLRIKNNGRPSIATNGNSAESNSAITINEWHHLVGTYNGTDLLLYVDGVFKKSKTTSMNTGGGKAAIGSAYGSTNWFNGSIDEVMLFNRTLDAIEISSLYTLGTKFKTNGTSLYYEGNVGIGTNNPTQELDVRGNVNVSGNVTADYFFGDGSQLTGINFDGLWTNSSGDATYTAGRVGIGTDDPSVTLDVNGSMHLDGVLTIDANQGGVLNVVRGSNNNIKTFMDSTYTDLRFEGKKEYNRIGTWINKSFQIVTDSTARITIDGLNGNVGIGTTSPDSLLDIVSAGSPTLTVQSSSDSNVQATVLIKGARTTSNSGDISNLEFWNGESGGEFQMAEIATRNADIDSGTTFSDLIFRTNDGSSVEEAMRIDDSGNVGIGTSSPVKKLHVLGDFYSHKDANVPGRDFVTNYSWTRRDSAADHTWRNIVWSSELGLFVAVSISSVEEGIMTSPDGVKWITRNSAANNAWRGITWSPELGIFAAVANSGTKRVMTSPDGITWINRTSADESNDWVAIAWSPELGIFAAVAEDGTDRLMTSSDGINWDTVIPAADNTWYSITWSPELGIFAAVAGSGTVNSVMTSSNGINWTSRKASSDSNWKDIAWSPELGLFVAVANTAPRVMTSSDGITWINQTPAATSDWSGVTWAPEIGLFAAVANSGANRLMTSPDGITWTTRTPHTESNSWREVAWSPELGVFAAVSQSGSGNRVMTSLSYKNAPLSWGGKLAVGRAPGAASIVASDDATGGWVIIDSTDANVGLNYYDDGDVILAKGGGDVGIDDTTPSQKLDVNGRIRMATWTADGDVVAYQDAATRSIALQASDSRMKKNIKQIDKSLNTIDQIKIYEYNSLDENDSDKKRIGLLGDELVKIMPELTFKFTKEGSNETYYGVHYDKLPVLNIKAIQEVKENFDALVEGTYSVESEAVFDEDSIGTATIVVNETEVKVKFNEEYETIPIITLTPLEFIDGAYKVSDKTTSGFSVVLQKTQEIDIGFDWHAFAQISSIANKTKKNKDIIKINKTKEKNETIVPEKEIIDINKTAPIEIPTNETPLNKTEDNAPIEVIEEIIEEEISTNLTIPNNITEPLEENQTIEEINETVIPENETIAVNDDATKKINDILGEKLVDETISLNESQINETINISENETETNNTQLTEEELALLAG